MPPGLNCSSPPDCCELNPVDQMAMLTAHVPVELVDVNTKITPVTPVTPERLSG